MRSSRVHDLAAFLVKVASASESWKARERTPDPGEEVDDCLIPVVSATTNP